MSDHVEKLSKFRKLFLEECADHLRTLETYFRPFVLEQASSTPGQLDEAFRAIHSIKGGAGMFGLERLIPLSHAVETSLDNLRHAQATLTKDESQTLLKAVDCLLDLVDAATAGIDLPEHYEARAVLAVEQSSLIVAAPTNNAETPEAVTLDPVIQANAYWQISFKPGPDLYRRGIEPLQLIRTLKSLGAVKVKTVSLNLPRFDQFDPAVNYLAWNIQLEGRCSQAEIEAVFEFAANQHELEITECPNGFVAELPEVHIKQVEVETKLPDRNTGVETASVGELGTLGPKSRSIRVELERVDKLVNLAGEIAISQGLVAQLFDQSIMNSYPKLFQEISTLLGLVQNLQDSVMSVRAQPLSSIFERMPRLVRELSLQLNKPIEIVFAGGTTEIDKSVLEQLVDPIVHLIRNAADHGVEPVETRRQLGKPETGTITLSALHIGSRVEIRVADDGSGLDHGRIRAKAVERKLIQAADALSREEIEQLIFLPGFSTANTISTVSGRGVGMDVVRKNIMQLGGKIRVESSPGLGTTFILSLPLTLAVLEGMVVRAGGDCYVIPTRNVLECRGHWQADTRPLPSAGRIMAIRDATACVYSLAFVFGRPELEQEGGIALITQLSNGSFTAFIVDEIIGQQQVVVKQLSTHIGGGEGLSGVSILGDGALALIVDLEEAAAMGQARLRHRPHDDATRSPRSQGIAA